MMCQGSLGVGVRGKHSFQELLSSEVHMQISLKLCLLELPNLGLYLALPGLH